MSETTFTLVRKDGVTDEDWPDNWTEVETKVEGDLADKVRAKVGAAADAVVTLWERGQDGGYSEWTQEWDVEFEVRVDGLPVFKDSLGWSSLDEDTGQPNELSRSWGNGLTRFIEWLDKP